MKVIDHPHLWIEGSCGPAGVLYGHFQRSCPVDGLTWQCGAVDPATRVPCGRVFGVAWDELDDLNRDRLAAEPSECLELPACPACGGVTMLNLNDVEYGIDLPEHTTMKILREHCAPRAALQLVANEISRFDGKHQGTDFSHLPKKDRPACHRKVDVAAEAAARVAS